MPRIFVCPLCDQELKNPSKHIRKHGVSKVEWHKLRLEREFIFPLVVVLNNLYVYQQLGTPEICERLGVTFRVLRDLLKVHNIPMRSMTDAIKAQWKRDDGKRSKLTSDLFRKINADRELFGDNNPARRTEVREKISIAKKQHNPGLEYFRVYLKSRSESCQTSFLCKNCGKKVILPRWMVYSDNRKMRQFCSHDCFMLYSGETSIEALMRQSLKKFGLEYTPQYRILRYFADFALINERIVIECDGDYWHRNTEDRDQLRDCKLNNLGWTVFRFRESEINNNSDQCVLRVIEFLYSRATS